MWYRLRNVWAPTKFMWSARGILSGPDLIQAIVGEPCAVLPFRSSSRNRPGDQPGPWTESFAAALDHTAGPTAHDRVPSGTSTTLLELWRGCIRSRFDAKLTGARQTRRAGKPPGQTMPPGRREGKFNG